MFIADGEFIIVQFEQAQWKLGGAVVGSAIDNLEFESTMFTTAESVLIDLQERSYRINIGGGLLGDVATYAALPSAGAALIITNTTVAPLYADALRTALAPKYAQVHLVALPDGEEHKNWQTLNLILMPCCSTVATAKPCCSRWVVESLAT